MKRLIRDYLEDIVREMENLERFAGGCTYGTFQGDDKTIYACIRSLEVIGEAAKHIPESARQKHKEIPWRGITGMRDILIHDYIGVNVKVIWKTVKEDIPKVKPLLRAMLDGTKE